MYTTVLAVLCAITRICFSFFFTNILEVILRIFGDYFMKIEILKKYEDLTERFLRVFEPNKGVLVDF